MLEYKYYKRKLMSDLTKEYFDEQLNKQTLELKNYAKEQTEDLARMVAGGFEDLQKRLDVKNDVEQLKREMKQIKEALHFTT